MTHDPIARTPIARTLVALDPERDAPSTLGAHDEDLLRVILAQPLVPAPRKRSTRRRARWSVAVAGATLAAAILGLTTVKLGGESLGPSPAAAAVLERAADVALRQVDPVVGPGQYLRVTLVQQSWAFALDDDGAVRTGRDGKPVASESRWTRQLWMPYGGSSDWIISERTEALRNASRDAAATNLDEPRRTYRFTSGFGDTYDPAWYATLPRDPERLMARLRAENRGDGDTDLGHLFDEVYSEVLRSGVAPAEIRAALFRGLAQTPGMRVVQGVTNLDGRPGIAIGAGAHGKQLLFDKATGQYIGERASSPRLPDLPGLDAAGTTFLSSVRTDVVDSAPAPD